MEYLIAAAALSVIGVGLIASIFGMIEFTHCFARPTNPQGTAQAHQSAGH